MCRLVGVKKKRTRRSDLVSRLLHRVMSTLSSAVLIPADLPPPPPTGSDPGEVLSVADMPEFAVFARPIRLNVGGKQFATTISTLTAGRAHGSRLARFFMNIDKLPRDSDGIISIDRDPEAFSLLLTWLRSGAIVCGDQRSRDLLTAEVNFWKVCQPIS